MISIGGWRAVPRWCFALRAEEEVQAAQRRLGAVRDDSARLEFGGGSGLAAGANSLDVVLVTRGESRQGRRGGDGDRLSSRPRQGESRLQ
jgi:hypothetical protein